MPAVTAKEFNFVTFFNWLINVIIQVYKAILIETTNNNWRKLNII